MPRPSPKTQTPGAQTKRDDQGRAHRAPEEQTDTDEQLDQGEEGVPDGDVGRQEVADVGDEVADHERRWPLALPRM